MSSPLFTNPRFAPGHVTPGSRDSTRDGGRAGARPAATPRRAPLEVADAPAIERARPMVRVAVLLFIASIAFDWPPQLNPLKIEFPTVAGFVLLFASLFQVRATFGRLPGAVMLFGLYLWMFVMASVAAQVVHLDAITRLFVNMVQVVLLCWILSNLLRERSLLRAALLTLVLACVARASMQLLGIGTASAELWTGGARTISLGQNANLSALILAGGLISTVGLHRSALDAPRWLHWFTWPIAALLVTAIIQTGSRGGLLASGAGLAVFALHGHSVLARVRNIVGTAIVLGLVAAAAWQTPMMRARLTESASGGHLAGREAIYPAALRMLRERPLLGWGPIENQYEIARRSPQRGLARSDAHNLMLELSTSTGLLGALPFVLALGISLRGALRARHTDTGLLPLALLAMCLTGTLSGTWIAAKILWFAIAFGIASDRPSP